MLIVFFKSKSSDVLVLLATSGDIVLNIIDRSTVMAFDCCAVEYSHPVISIIVNKSKVMTNETMVSPFGGPFSPFKGLFATFFLYVVVFLLRFSCGGGGGGFFPPFEGLSATFFSMWCFCFYGDPF